MKSSFVNEKVNNHLDEENDGMIWQTNSLLNFLC